MSWHVHVDQSHVVRTRVRRRVAQMLEGHVGVRRKVGLDVPCQELGGQDQAIGLVVVDDEHMQTFERVLR